MLLSFGLPALVLFYVKVETFPASFCVVWLLFESSDPASFSACSAVVLLARAREGLKKLLRFVPLWEELRDLLRFMPFWSPLLCLC
jgi:hypothetical protein